MFDMKSFLSSPSETTTGFTLSIRPVAVAAVILLYGWLIRPSVSPFLPEVLIIGVLALLAILIPLYRGISIEVSFSKLDYLVLLFLFGLQLLCHWDELFLSLGGDELYHAERAAQILTWLRMKVEKMPLLPMEEYRQNIWRLFDLRHFPVIDLWRFLSLLLIISVYILYRWSRRISGRLFYPGAILGIAVLFYIGKKSGVGPENHPPLRLLPLFIGHTVFGLNSFAFRLPSIIAVTIATFALYKLAARTRPDQPLWWILLCCSTTMFIPVVFYVATAVEPSVYGYVAYILMFVIYWRWHEERTVFWIIWAGLTAGGAVLFRQSTVVLWLAPLYMLLRTRGWNFASLCRICLPGVFAIPYLYTVKVLGHGASQADKSSWFYLWDSVINGVGVMAILNTTTLPWAFAGFSFLAYLLRYEREKIVPLLGMFIPAYILFHTIWEYLWGLGRYQAEYVAPFLAAMIVLICMSASHRSRRYFGILFPLLIVGTLELHSNLSLDINYAQWPQMRVTSSAQFPYREAFNTLKRKETQGNFVLAGGSPWYGDMVLWLSGFDFTETATWRSHQNTFNDFIMQGPSLAETYRFCKNRKIEYVVLQTGTRREEQHRLAPGSTTLHHLEFPPMKERSFFLRYATFVSKEGGILNLLAVR